MFLTFSSVSIVDFEQVNVSWVYRIQIEVARLRKRLLISFTKLKRHPLKERRCKFKIDKITWSKCSVEQTYYFDKNKPSMYP